MSVRKILIVLGIIVALSPYLGFPSWVDTVVNTFAGLAIVFFLLMKKSAKLSVPTDSVPIDASSERSNEEKELRVKRGADKNSSPVRMEKQEILSTETERVLSSQTSSVVSDAGAPVLNATPATATVPTTPARGRGARVSRTNKL